MMPETAPPRETAPPTAAAPVPADDATRACNRRELGLLWRDLLDAVRDAACGGERPC